MSIYIVKYSKVWLSIVKFDYLLKNTTLPYLPILYHTCLWGLGVVKYD